MRLRSSRRLSVLFLSGLVALAAAPHADAQGHELSSLEQPWSRAVLYRDSSNRWLSEFALQGRLMVQFADGRDNDGDQLGTRNAPEFTRWGESLEVRRWRLGPRVRFARYWMLDGHINIRPDLAPVYLNIYDVQLTWSRTPALNVSVGKTKIPFSQEYTVSSARIPTLERSLLTNQIITTPLTGVSAYGRRADWRYRFGVYANDPRPVDDFSRFDAGVAVLAKLAHNVSPALGVDEAWVGLDAFLHTEPTANLQPQYTRAFSLTSELSEGRLGWQSDILWSGGRGVESVGMTFLPTYRVTSNVQLIARAHAAASFGGDGLLPAVRYERLSGALAPDLSPDGRANRAVSGYAGITYYLHGHGLKTMVAVERAALAGGQGGGGSDQWSFLSGVRAFF